MADKEITSQIDKLRKTRPERAVDAELNAVADPMGNDADSLIAALSFLHTDLKEEARLIELAKIRGGTTLIKDRLMVASWLELFVIQLKRLAEEPKAPIERLAPSTELGEHRPSEIGTPAAVLPGPGDRCAVGNVHDEHTLKCPCGYTASLVHASQSSPLADAMSEDAELGASVKDYLSGASDELFASLPLGIDLSAAMTNDVGIDTPGARALIDSLPKGSMTIVDALDTPSAPNGSPLTGDEPIGTQVTVGGIEFTKISDDPFGAEQELHREVRAMTQTFPIADDPFAPIPAARYNAWPIVPPGGVKWTATDLLAPVLASTIPAHLSFSQITTVTDCGAKYRMQRIANVPQVPQWANIGGKAFHACVETIEESGMQEKLTDSEAVANLWGAALHTEIARVEHESDMGRDQFRASNGGKENYDWWRIEGALMLQRYTAWRLTGGAGQSLLNRPVADGGDLMLEWETVYMVDNVPFTTILDSVWINTHHDTVMGISERTAIIRDWKTGSMTPDDRQLCTQAWGLRKAGWQGPVLVQFFDARKGTFTEPFDPFERMSWDDVRYFVLSGDAERRLPILPARPSDFCGGCSVAYACPVMAQRKAPKK